MTHLTFGVASQDQGRIQRSAVVSAAQLEAAGVPEPRIEPQEGARAETSRL